MTIRINIGSGRTPTLDWHNYDNSWSIRFSGLGSPIVLKVLEKVRLLVAQQREFIEFARKADIKWADAAKHIPEQDNSVEVIYSSHMLEHLDREEAYSFLREARRILKHGGIIRLAVPSIRYHVENYVKDGDADRFIENVNLARAKPRSFFEKMRFLVSGSRNHHWMYDGKSLCKLLDTGGFIKAKIMKSGSTMIGDPGELNLRELFPESVFVEAVNPSLGK